MKSNTQLQTQNLALNSMQELKRLRSILLNGTREDLEKEIENINTIYNKSHKDYFDLVKNFRGMYIVEMRRQYAEGMYKMGVTFEEIASFLGLKSHSTVIHLLRGKKSIKSVEKLIKENMLNFIDDSIYPIQVKEKLVLANIDKISSMLKN